MYGHRTIRYSRQVFLCAAARLAGANPRRRCNRRERAGIAVAASIRVNCHRNPTLLRYYVTTLLRYYVTTLHLIPGSAWLSPPAATRKRGAAKEIASALAIFPDDGRRAAPRAFR
jgi:hypothetical protein